ncbi:hypothetical protein JQK87_18040 [Streptomyces sp. G44]|nr:hypothetical protein [Streptomyces sp. G44]
MPVALPKTDAFAIVGLGCRLPGGITDLAGLWEALEAGRDLVGPVPDDRFEAGRFVDTAMARPGKSYTDLGGFLTDIAGFDAAYFGISPREAAHMDPQHRLLLETAVEALDDAAIDPDTLAGSDTCVFTGVSDFSYGGLQMAGARRMNAYSMAGAAHAIAANRLSHFFDLRGPSMAIDTACSSGPFLRTGDLGFLLEGELYVTGRAKDLIIVNGRNVHPQDIERVSETTDPATGPCAAFALPDPSGTERVVLVQEVRPLHLDGRTPADLADLIKRRLAQELRLAAHVVIVGPMGVPRTTSGKVQRARARDELRSSGFTPLHSDLPAPA